MGLCLLGEDGVELGLVVGGGLVVAGGGVGFVEAGVEHDDVAVHLERGGVIGREVRLSELERLEEDGLRVIGLVCVEVEVSEVAHGADGVGVVGGEDALSGFEEFGEEGDGFVELAQ